MSQVRPAVVSSHRPRPVLFAGAFLAFCVIAGVIADWSYRTQREDIERGWRAQLDEMVTLKVRQVSTWRRERLGDALVALADRPLVDVIQRVLVATPAPSDSDRGILLAWMDALRENYRYDNVLLLDRDGTTRLASGPLRGSPEAYAALASRVRPAQRVSLEHVAGVPQFLSPHFIVVASINTTEGAALGTLLFGIDPTAVLYGSVLTWASSRTGEIGLTQIDGESLRAMSPIRRAGDKAAPPQQPLIDLPVPIVAAVRTERLAEGPDGSAVPMLARAAPIPGSLWHVVATVDREEVDAPIRELLRRVVGATTALMAFAGIGIVVGYRHQRDTFARQQQESDAAQQILRTHYQFLHSFGNDAIVLLDDVGRILDLNDRLTECVGHTREELLGESVRMLRSTRAAAEFDEAWSTIQSKGRLLFETVGARRDGTEFPLEISARLIDIEGVTFCQSILRDITERRRDEQQIRRLNRLYAVASDCGRAIVQSTDEAELFARVCRSAVDPGGFRLVSISTVESGTTRIVPVARAGESSEYLDRIQLATDGPLGQGASGRAVREQRPVIINDIADDPTTAPWRDELSRFGLCSLIALPLKRGGAVFGLLTLYAGERGFFDEVEARLAEEVAESVSFAVESLEQERWRREAEVEMSTSRDRLERVLEAINEGYWDWRLDTDTVHLSARYQQMLGYEPGELALGFDAWASMLHPDDAAAAQAAFRQFIDGGRDLFFSEYRMRTRSGAYVWVRSRGKVAARGAGGVPTRLVGTNTDITEQKRLEEQFLQAQKLESVGRLAGGVAHDFNNLLTVINGYSELVLNSLPAGDANWQHLDAVRQAGDRAAALTQQLLAFSRKQATQPRALGLNQAVSEFDRLLRRLIGDDVELLLQLDADPDCVMVDPAQLHQVVMNLVINARDAMPSGGRILVRTGNIDVSESETMDADPGAYVVLSVTDTGTGMDEDTRRQIFEPFFTTKEAGRGTGLGLSTVYGIVRQARGFIRVESQPGKGSAFVLYWPRTTVAIQATTTRVPTSRLAGTETVLVVEDQPGVRALAVRVLSGRGYRVLQAADGADALVQASTYQGPIHVLVTDVVMPGLDGQAVATRLIAQRPEIKVIFTSGYTDDVLGERGILNPDTAYLAKPFTPDALAAKIRDVLKDAPPAVDRADTPHRTILIADDDESVRKLFARCLSRDYRVLQAADGEEAVRLVEQHPDVALLITDLFMPKLEGIETIQAVRRIRPALHIIAISGAFGGRYLDTAERMGVSATLSKPIHLEDLRRAVADTFAPPA